jgi:hypothetical protein
MLHVPATAGDQKLPTFSRVTVRPSWLVFAGLPAAFLTPAQQRGILCLKAARCWRLADGLGHA